jgi:DNA primase
MQISENKILEIKQAADIHDVVSEYVALKKAGKDYVGLCPFHGEKTPSFTVSTEKQMYFCFGCGTAGDVFEFLMKKNGMSFLEVAKQLAARYGIDLPETSASVSHRGTPKPPGRTRGQRSEVRSREETEIGGQPSSQSFAAPGKSESTAPPELWQEKAGKLVAWAHEKLLANSEQLKILAARGIKIETIKHFRLGWNPGKNGKDLFRPRESWGLPTEMKNGRKKKLWLPIGLVADRNEK